MKFQNITYFMYLTPSPNKGNKLGKMLLIVKSVDEYVGGLYTILHTLLCVWKIINKNFKSIYQSH